MPSEEGRTDWAGPKGSLNYRQNGNADPAPPPAIHRMPRPLDIDRALIMECREWTRKNKFARETYYREGKGVYEKQSTL